MKLLLKENVSRLGKLGEIVEVKAGYARNYLLPQGLAVQPTAGNIKAVEKAKQRYLEEMAKRREELEARAQVLEGKEVTIAARANEEGHLYGSIGPAQIVAALGEQSTLVEPKDIRLDQAIRRLDKYDVTIQLDEDVTATIHVWIVPVHEHQEAKSQGPPAASEDLSGESADTLPSPEQPQPEPGGEDTTSPEMT